jgi:hypothetical protein
MKNRTVKDMQDKVSRLENQISILKKKIDNKFKITHCNGFDIYDDYQTASIDIDLNYNGEEYNVVIYIDKNKNITDIIIFENAYAVKHAELKKIIYENFNSFLKADLKCLFDEFIEQINSNIEGEERHLKDLKSMVSNKETYLNNLKTFKESLS